VSVDPEPLGRLEEIKLGASIAHETIFDLRRALVDRGRATPAIEALLAESATITLEAVPRTTAPIERLAARWREQSVLAPGEAASTAGELRTEFDRIEPTLRSLANRQRQIALQLTAALKDER
jgi:hypothetical protein